MVNGIVKLVTQISCNSVTKKQNETLSVRVNYTYQGPAKTARFYAVVTQVLGTLEFDEIGSTKKYITVTLPESLTVTTYYTNITGLPLSGCSPKSGYGVKVYVLDLNGQPEWGCKNVITVQSSVITPELGVTSLSLS